MKIKILFLVSSFSDYNSMVHARGLAKVLFPYYNVEIGTMEGNIINNDDLKGYSMLYCINCVYSNDTDIPILFSSDLISKYGNGIDLDFYYPKKGKDYNIWDRKMVVGYNGDNNNINELKLSDEYELLIFNAYKHELSKLRDMYHDIDCLICELDDIKYMEAYGCGIPVLFTDGDVSTIISNLDFMRANYMDAVNNALECRDDFFFNNNWKVLGESYYNEFEDIIHRKQDI